MKGVESHELDPAARVVRIVLHPDNRVRLESIRDLIKGVGFTPASARVRVRGKVLSAAGGSQFQVEGLDQAYRLSMEPSKLPPAGETVTLEGTVPPQSDPRALPELVVDGAPLR
jgi:hypothetical protein